MQFKKTLFCIGFVYPEPKSSAAGMRILQLLELFLENNYKVVFGTTAKNIRYSFPLESIGVEVKSISLNDSSFDAFVLELNPSIVLFDRFMTEEQFGWRVSKNCPKALRILDTEDLHFLRKSRQENIKDKFLFSKEFLDTDLAKREIASIYRSDITLIISEFEYNILVSEVGIDPDILFYIPYFFSFKEFKIKNPLPDFHDRKNFVFVGNFMHPPNLKAILYLKNKIWPRIIQKNPEVELHIYGSYATKEHLSLSDSKNKFKVKGRIDDLYSTLSTYRLMLVPLEFGAGLKGKVIDSMRCGTPCALSSIAAEGIFGNFLANGFIEDKLEEFTFKAAKLYSNKHYWEVSQNNGFEVIKKRFSKSIFVKPFMQKVTFLMTYTEKHRLKNVVGLILEHHSMKSTKYLSKWIEEKNRISK